MKTETVADIAIAVMAYVFITKCWGQVGGGGEDAAGLVWGGMCVGYLVTVYLNEGEEK